MLKEQVEGKTRGLQVGNAGSRDITKLPFDLANFNFSLKNINKSVSKTKELLKAYTGASGCTLMFLDSHGYLWKIGEKTTYPFKLGEGVAGWAAKYKKEVYIESAQNDKRYKPLSKKFNGPIVAIPIIKNDKVLGVLNLTYIDKKLLLPNKKVLAVFSKKLQSILENIILYHDSQEQRKELSLRKDVANILESNLSLKQKIEEIKKITVKFVDVSTALIFLIDPQNRKNPTPLFLLENSKKNKLITGLRNTYAKEMGQQAVFFDLSDRTDIGPIIKNKANRTTMYPIFSGRRMIGLIILEDPVKNIDNFSTLEKHFIRLLSNKIGKYITSELSSKKIIEEKERWRTIFHNVDDGIILLSKGKKVVEANLKAREILGSKTKSLGGKDLFSLFKIIDPEIESPTLSSLKNFNKFQKDSYQDLSKKIDNFFSAHRTIRPKEYYIKTSNGKYWVIISMKTAMQDLEAEMYGIIHIKDVTKRKEVEQDKNEFMSMVSHELRTPLSAMKGYLSMALNDDYGKLNERQEKSLRRVEESNERMVTLVEDILDVSRIELGRFSLCKEPVNLSESICMMIQELGAKIKAKKIIITVQGISIDCCLKETSKKTRHKCKDLNIYVLADRARLMQILQNLIDNAVKYSFDGGKIDINLKSNKDFAEILVKDNGVGVAKEDQDKLFRRFSRIHNPLSIQAGGTGLGLYITKMLVLKLGGEISVSSTQGKGTTFSVKIPIAKQLPLI